MHCKYSRVLTSPAFLSLSALVILSLFLTASVSAQDASISDILPRVQENVAILKSQTGNFICGESSGQGYSSYAKGTRSSTLRYIRYIPVPSDGKSFRPSSYEMYGEINVGNTKTIIKQYTYDGNKTQFKKSNKILNGFDALFSWLDKENERCFDFELLGNEAIDSRDVYKIKAKAKPDAKKAGKICQSFQENWNSTIWIDRETMQVVRLLTDPIKVNIPRIAYILTKGTIFSIDRFDYAPILVGQESWWLPVANHHTMKRNDKVFQEGDSEYRDYKMFKSSVKIEFENHIE